MGEKCFSVLNGYAVKDQFSRARLGEVYVTLKQFGAVGDGVTDDTQALVSALTFCDTNKVNLVIPDGTYIVSARNHLGNFSDFNVIGAGNAVIQSKINLADSTTTGFLLSFSGAKNITFENLEIIGTTETVSVNDNDVGFYFDGAENITIRNCRIHDFKGTGIRLRDAVNCAVYDNEIYNCTTNAIVPSNEIHGLQIVGNYIHDNPYASINAEWANMEEIAENIVISRNVIVGANTACSINLGGVEETGYRYKNCIISENYIKRTGTLKKGIICRGVDGLTIANNILEYCTMYFGDASSNGVYTSVKDLLITGNSIDNGSIYLYGSVKNTNVKCNTFKNLVASSGSESTTACVYCLAGNVNISGNTFENCHIAVLNTQGDANNNFICNNTFRGGFSAYGAISQKGTNSGLFISGNMFVGNVANCVPVRCYGTLTSSAFQNNAIKSCSANMFGDNTVTQANNVTM